MLAIPAFLQTSVHGDPAAKVYYTDKCLERKAIKMSVIFKNETEAEAAGYKKAEVCTLPQPQQPQTRVKPQPQPAFSIPSAPPTEPNSKPSPVPSSKPLPAPAPKKGPKTAKPILAANILAIKYYYDTWVDRPVVIRGWITVTEPESPHLGPGTFHFLVQDNTKERLVLIAEGKWADALTKKIILNDGEGLPGTFTFIINSRRAGGYLIGEMSSYTINNFHWHDSTKSI
jgi:hypothetical protein